MLEPRNTVLFIRTDACVFDPRIRKEAASLHKDGYHVIVFGWDRRRQFPRTENIAGVQYERSRIPAPYGSKMLLFLLPFFCIHAMITIMKHRPAVIHACDLDGYIPAMLMRPILHHKIVYDIFDHFSEKVSHVPNSVRAFIRYIDRILMKRADVVIVTDEKRRELIHSVPHNRIEVIMNVPPIRQMPTFPRTRQTIRICYTGVIHEHRGLRVIADAVTGVPGIETFFAGWIPRRIDERFLLSHPSLNYLGILSYEKSLDLIASSDIILALYDPQLPINARASSNKIFEAMATSKPVITNQETAMAAIVEQTQCGCIIRYGDPQELRAAIIQLRDNPELRARLGANGFEAFKGKYNWQLMETRLQELYRSLVNSGFKETSPSIA